jgi:hypothetical protein
VTRVLHPLACRTLPDGRERVRAQAATDRRLELALWQLDRRVTGDVQLQRVDVPSLVASVRRALDAHAELERSLVTDLAERLTQEQREQLGQDLAAALLRAPTRPHPDTRHGGWSAASRSGPTASPTGSGTAWTAAPSRRPAACRCGGR